MNRTGLRVGLAWATWVVFALAGCATTGRCPCETEGHLRKSSAAPAPTCGTARDAGSPTAPAGAGP